MKKLAKKYGLIAFLLSLALGCLIVIPNIILGGKGIYTLLSDFNLQQIPFNKVMNEAIKNGELWWTWRNDLGSNFIAIFSFYNLFSPFNLIGFLFPADFFVYLVGPIYILKYGVAGLSSYLFLKRYVKNPQYAIIGCLLYTFSGFQLTNILFYHFHDAVAFFPLLLYTLDNLVYDNKKGRFALAMALCAFTNWFFFIGQVFFLIIYYLVKIFIKDYKFDFKKLKMIIIEGLLGTFLAAIVLVPSLLLTLGNPRIGKHWKLKNAFIYSDSSRYLELLRAFFLPPEIMHSKALLNNVDFVSLELYLPLIGFIFTLTYLLKHPKKWESILILILIIIMFVPILNSIFFAFNPTYYARWFYMLILIMSLASIKALEEKMPLKKSMILFISGAIIYFLLLLIYSKNHQVIYNSRNLIYMVTLAIVNLILTFGLTFIKKEKWKINTYIILIMLSITFSGNYVTYRYKFNQFKVDETYYNYLMGNIDFNLEKNTRYNTNNCLLNISYLYDMKNVNSWNSNVSNSANEFYQSYGYERYVVTEIPADKKLLNDFLSIKYFIDCGHANLSKDGYQFYQNKIDYNIYINKEAKPLGFIVNDYLNVKDFNKLSNEEKLETLNKKVVLNTNQIKKYKNLISYEQFY